MASGRRKIVFLIVFYVLVLVAFEVGARLVYFVGDGFNPYFLSYGLIADTQYHSREERGYSKFEPNSVYRQKLPDRTLEMNINSHGFRGADFARPKPNGTVRVVCLGASSTFGYNVADDATYPQQLGEMLLDALPGRPIEVINLGVPHLRLANIVALARFELEPLEPDVVILYAGYNNSILMADRSEANLAFKIKDWLAFHSVGWKSVHHLVRSAYYRVSAALNRDVAGLPNLSVPIVLEEETLSARRKLSREEYRSDLEALGELVDRIGARFVLVTQTFTLAGFSHGLPKAQGYYEELEIIEDELATNGGVLAPRATLLIHHDLMNELRSFATQHSTTLVEGIAALDPGRAELMASFVHLNARGNERLAAAIRDALIEQRVLESGARRS